MKEQIIEKVKDLHKEHSTIYAIFMQNIKNPVDAEKKLNMQMGLVSMKLTYIESLIYAYCEVLTNYLDVDIKSEVSIGVYNQYYTIKNHVAKQLNLTEGTLELDPQIEEQLKIYKDGFKKE